MNKINGREVQCSLTSDRNFIRGVVTGFQVNVSEDDVKGNVKNANVKVVKCLKAYKNWIKCGSSLVPISFSEESLPAKIFIGFTCYDVTILAHHSDVSSIRDLDTWQQCAR